MATSDETKRKRREYQQAWRAKNPGYQARWQQENREASLIHSRKYHGIIDPSGEERSGPCEICAKPVEKLKYDHDHATGRARGWLCHKCNVGLHYAENPEWLARASEYLRSHRLTDGA